MTERRPGRLARTLVVVGVALALLGGVVTPIAMSRVAEVGSITGAGENAEGSVVAVETIERGLAVSRREYSVATVQFTTAAGETRTATLEKAISGGAEPYSVGERIAITYDTADPSRVVNAGPGESDDAFTVAVIAWSILGSGLLVAALGALISRLRPGGRASSPAAG